MGPSLRNPVCAMSPAYPEVWQRPAGTGGSARAPGPPKRPTELIHEEGVAIMADQVDEKPGVAPFWLVSGGCDLA